MPLMRTPLTAALLLAVLPLGNGASSGAAGYRPAVNCPAVALQPVFMSYDREAEVMPASVTMAPGENASVIIVPVEYGWVDRIMAIVSIGMNVPSPPDPSSFVTTI